jgi:hypothetical protein
LRDFGALNLSLRINDESEDHKAFFFAKKGIPGVGLERIELLNECKKVALPFTEGRAALARTASRAQLYGLRLRILGSARTCRIRGPNLVRWGRVLFTSMVLMEMQSLGVAVSCLS